MAHIANYVMLGNLIEIFKIITTIMCSWHERIFSRIDWSSIADEKSIHYILWTPDEKKIIEPPIPSKFREIPCEEVDASKLTIGDVYPGKFGGFKLSCDHRGKIFKRVPSGREYFEGYEWDKTVELFPNLAKEFELINLLIFLINRQL